jgi:hypothetical protein
MIPSVFETGVDPQIRVDLFSLFFFPDCIDSSVVEVFGYYVII